MKRYETYKDSGVLWQEKIPSHWRLVSFKRLFSFGRGLSITKADLVEEGIPVISYGQIHSKQNTGTKIEQHLLRYVPESYTEGNDSSKVNKGDFIFADTSEDLEGCGNSVYIDKDYLLYAGYHSIIARSIQSSDNKYLAYLFKTDCWRSQIRSSVNGVKVFSVTQSTLSDSTVILPPVEEQITIASYLDHKVSQIDGAIAEKEQMLEELKAYRSAIISETVTKGLDKTVEMKDSGIEWIGNIPETWKIVRIKHILDYKTDSLRVGPFGSSLSGNDFKTEGYWVYNQRVVLDNNFNTNDTFISQEKYEELGNFKVFAGDILLTTRGTIGKVAIVPNTFHEGVLHPCLIRFRVDDSIVNKDFLAYYFNDTNLILDQVKYNSNSTTIDVIYSYTLKELIVSLPPLDVQNDIVAHLNYKVQKIDEMLKEVSQSVENLKSYKSTLITEAVTGKIDLREWKLKSETA